MTTKVYGCSDDAINFEGDVTGKAFYPASLLTCDLLVVCSDGTLLKMAYGKTGVWSIEALREGPLFGRIEECPDAEVPSDVAYFEDGLTWAYASSEWVQV